MRVYERGCTRTRTVSSTHTHTARNGCRDVINCYSHYHSESALSVGTPPPAPKLCDSTNQEQQLAPRGEDAGKTVIGGEEERVWMQRQKCKE